MTKLCATCPRRAPAKPRYQIICPKCGAKLESTTGAFRCTPRCGYSAKVEGLPK